MDFIFEQLRIGGDRNFAYLIGDRRHGEAAIVDPAYHPEAVIERAEAQGLAVRYIINTHGHGDHTNGNAEARKRTGAPVAAFEGAASKPGEPLRDGSRLAIGDYGLRFLHTPGHADDHLVIFIEGPGVAITGDLLFVGKIGGTGSDRDARVEWESLQRVLRELPEATTVWPGHDYGCRPSSTIGLEKAANPFLRCADIAAFLELKKNWSGFKQEHGLK